MGWAILVMVIMVIVVAGIIASQETKQLKAMYPNKTAGEIEQIRVNQARAKAGRATFSDAAKDGRCPKCGSAAFKAKRSRGAKVAGVATLGVGALAAPKSRVQCIGCKTEYTRG